MRTFVINFDWVVGAIAIGTIQSPSHLFVSGHLCCSPCRWIEAEMQSFALVIPDIETTGSDAKPDPGRAEAGVCGGGLFRFAALIAARSCSGSVAWATPPNSAKRWTTDGWIALDQWPMSPCISNQSCWLLWIAREEMIWLATSEYAFERKSWGCCIGYFEVDAMLA
jgi:hypothetical protein